MMAASKPTSWLFTQLHILHSTKFRFGTLTGGLGCLPLDNEAYPPLSDSRDKAIRYSEFDNCWYPGLGPANNQCSTPACYSHEASPKAISKRTSYHQV